MPEVELKLKPSNEEIAAISRNHPDVEFQLLDSYRIKEETLMSVLFEIQTPNPESIVESFDEMTKLHSYEILHTGETVVLIRCLIDEPAPSRAARASKNLVKPPLVLHNGWIFATFTASDDNISQFKDKLESAGVRYQVISIGPPSDPIDRLTKRQQEVLDEAVDRGYYETPRECSITELAIGLGVTKGTVSRVLHRAESAIIKEIV